MTAETFQRARRPEQKLQRQDAILSAARELALRDGVRNVSLADIAARVGIHKSALLRYFETREQIFLELTAEAWRDWAEALHAGLDAAAPGSAGLVADVFARSFGDRPVLCDLIAHTPLNLERNVSPEGVRRYKLTSLGVVNEAAALVQQVLPELTLAECTEFVATLASLAGSLWQIANPGPVLAELYASDPALGQACVVLTPRLRRTAEILLAGLIPSRNQGVLGGGPGRVNRDVTMHVLTSAPLGKTFSARLRKDESYTALGNRQVTYRRRTADCRQASAGIVGCRHPRAPLLPFMPVPMRPVLSAKCQTRAACRK